MKEVRFTPTALKDLDSYKSGNSKLVLKFWN